MENTTSDCSATAFGLSAHCAFFARSDSAFDFVRLVTVMANPRSIKCPHMLRPITPVPIQPRRVLPGATEVGMEVLSESKLGSCCLEFGMGELLAAAN